MKKKLAVLAVGAAICLFAAQEASAAQVTVVPGTTAYGLFDLLGTPEYDPLTSTTTIYLDVSAFVAELPSATPIPFFDRKFDTISFELIAGSNERITKVSYSEGLQSIVTPNTGFSFTASTGSAVVNNVSNGLGTYNMATEGTSVFTMETSYVIPGMETEVDVSITNDIMAFAYGDAYAKVMKNYAKVEVTSAPVPVPATLWLLGSAIAGLAATRRKRQEV
ncbi:MAG: VPLPA-CTERM sorting domain-containing protein [Desulfobulbaceae bacterium]|nr:VPLPA-CTERM sorting domain-containing protein [Desulfobulbaceae bacterium]